MNSFKRNLLITYGLSLFLLILSAGASYISIRNLIHNTKQVNKTNEVIKTLESVLSSVKDGESGQRGYLITKDEKFLTPYKGAYERSKVRIASARDLISEDVQQERSMDSLENLVNRRFAILQAVIEEQEQTAQLNPRNLEYGRVLMESIRSKVREMERREQDLLSQRTSKMNQFAAATPVFILVASGLSILITIFSFARVNNDFEKRSLLNKELETKEKEIFDRIHIIETIANKISSGDYKSRINEADNDLLGPLAVSLNKMAESLDYSFSNLAREEWQKTGISLLNEKIIGENNLQTLTFKVIETLTSYTRSNAGAFYLSTNDNMLELSASLAADKKTIQQRIAFGEGIVGQAAVLRREVMISDIPEQSIMLNYSAGSIKPLSIIAIPVFHEKTFKGVIELATINPYTDEVVSFLREAVFNIGMAIHSAKDHQRLQDLLAKTRAQSAELQVQQNALENINTELEAQAAKLQSSEEELRVQQEELQQANQELEERSRLLEEKNELILERNLKIQAKAEELALTTRYKSEFLANMSHELRTPLNSILLLSRLLTENHENTLSKDQVEYAEVIQSSGKGLLTLIDEILDLSKIESGKMELEFTEVNPKEITEELRSLFAPMAKEKGIDLILDVKDNVPVIFETDKQRVGQIMKNLVSNALKFTKRGTVCITISKENENLLFSVQDSGIGIAPEKQEIIFEAFQQADGSTRRQFGGTGLGLSISRELAKLLGGGIRLKSEEGKGSEFTLWLPVKRSRSSATRFTGETTEWYHNENQITEPVQANKSNDRQFISENIPGSVPDDRDNIEKDDKVILIIEDDTAFARSLLDYTRKKGYKGIVSVRGDEGIELAKQFMPTGILLDVQLPVKSGFEVMEELKSNLRTRTIPIHMMSSHQVKTKSLAKGAVDFIDKPVTFERLGEMFEKIEQALNQYPKKVMIVEENAKHAQALAFFLERYNVHTQIRSTVEEGVESLKSKDVDCVILDMGIPAINSVDLLEDVKKTAGLENLPVIVFTGKNLSHTEEKRIRQYADSIVVKTAQSYQRILDEVSLFLHLVEENAGGAKTFKYKKPGEISEILKDKTVLVADDDVRNIFSLTRSLESYGMKVISAIDGNDALKQVQEEGKVDLVLMDMMMPEMDGYESIKRIRQIQRFKNLPIIAVTAKAMTGDREKCIEAGASDYITKPVDLDQLVSLLRVWLY